MKIKSAFVLLAVASAYAAPVASPDPFLGSYLNGVTNGVVDMVKGVANVVLHPIDTLKGVGQAITHPITTAKAVTGKIKDTYEKKGLAYTLGHATVDVGSIVIPLAGAKGASQLAKAADTAGDIGVLSKTGETVADLSKVGETVADLSKAGETVADLSKAGETVADLSKAGETVADLSKTGETVADLTKAGETVEDLSNTAKAGDIVADAEKVTDGASKAAAEVTKKRRFDTIRTGLGAWSDSGKSRIAQLKEYWKLERGAKMTSAGETLGGAAKAIKGAPSAAWNSVKGAGSSTLNFVKSPITHIKDGASWIKNNPWKTSAGVAGVAGTAQAGKWAGSDEADWSGLIDVPAQALAEIDENGGDALQDAIHEIMK